MFDAKDFQFESCRKLDIVPGSSYDFPQNPRRKYVPKIGHDQFILTFSDSSLAINIPQSHANYSYEAVKYSGLLSKIKEILINMRFYLACEDIKLYKNKIINVTCRKNAGEQITKFSSAVC
jgi:hypothetical protein